MWEVVKICFWSWLIVYVVVGFLTMPYDDTDDRANKERSGLVLYTDHGTGCQYIKPGSLFGGGLTPRLDGDGRHVGCR
jgi:hypothetical protein